MSSSLWPYGLQHTRLPCPSPSPRACSNSCPLNRWCHPTISSSVIPFSSCLQSFPASGSFPVSRLFASGGQSVGASASESLPLMTIRDWFPLGLTGLTSLLLLTHTLSSLSRSLQVVMHSLWRLETEFAFKSTTLLSGFQASLKSDSRPSVS